MDFDIAVIGAGMIGSSAAFALAEQGLRTVLIGPDEPADKGNHTAPYGSHHDAGRITRSLASDAEWGAAAHASIARYRDLEQRSGIAFFNECGAALIGPTQGPGSGFTQKVEQTARELATPHQRLSDADLRVALPDYDLPTGSVAFFEPENAGTINPRAYLAAIWALGTRAGMLRLNHTAQSVRPIPDGIEITGPGMKAIRARHAIIATGAYGTEGLWPMPAPLRRYGRTVVMIEIQDDLAQQLARMPAVIWQPPGDGVDYYILPPVRYPDGRLRAKIGGDPEDRVLPDTQAVNDWFKSSGDAQVAAHLLRVLTGLVPALTRAPQSAVSSAACVTSFTPNNRPMITRDGPVTFALGGCGAAAKSALELGRRAAKLALA